MTMPVNEQERRDALPRGRVLRDYTIEAVLGHGGFGIVYRARHNELGNSVAVKEYLPAELAVREGSSVQVKSGAYNSPYEDGLRRFRDEARALIDFQSHPSIVSCREFFRANGTAYLVMEHEHGLPLSALLQQREAAGRPFGEEDLLAVMAPLLDGLARVHEAGVLHRDIKPGNILVRRLDEHPVLIDFGAAKQAVAEHSKSMAPYTDGYAALEQVGEGELGAWTDLYAVGAVMWRMVAGGNPPWAPPNPVKVEKRANAVVRGSADPMPSARELGAGRFSPGVLDAIDRCLKLNEKERMRDCGQLLGLLHGDGGAVEAPVEFQPSGDERNESDGEREDRGFMEALELPRERRNWVGIAAVGLTGLLALLFIFMPSESKDVFGFRIETRPEEATVELLNGKEPYRAGMRLVPGRYEVAVSAPGYEPRLEEVEHRKAGTLRRIVLERVTADQPGVPQQPETVAGSLKPKDAGGFQKDWKDAALARAESQWNEVKSSKDREVMQAYIEEYVSVAGAGVWVKLAE